MPGLKAFKMFDPVAGTIHHFDCTTGAELTPAQVATVSDCPEIQTQWDDTCLQPTGNTDPTLVVSGWCASSYTVDPDTGVITPVGTPQLFNEDKSTDVTATHEITACPSSNLIPVGTACYDDGSKREEAEAVKQETPERK